MALVVRHLWLRRPLPKPRDFLLPALLMAAVFNFNQAYYGSLLPHTAQVKIDQGNSGLWGEWPLFLHAGYHLDWFFGGSRFLVGLLALGTACGGWALRAAPPARILVIFLALEGLFYIGFNIPSYHWYYAPFYLGTFFFAGAGFLATFRRVENARHWWRSSKVVQGLGLALALLLSLRLFALTEARLTAPSFEPPYQRIGLWLKENVPAGSSLAAAEIGTLGWYSELPIVDILGLVTPRNSRFLGERKFAAWLDLYSPDYALLHAPPWPAEKAVINAAANGRFVRDSRFSFKGFQLFKATGREARESLGEILQRLKGAGQTTQRQALAREILQEGLYRPIPIDGPNLLAVHLTADRWTRGTTPAAIAIRNPGVSPLSPRIQLACVASEEDLPITATVDEGIRRRRYTFTEAGFKEAQLAELAPGESRLILFWSDKGWTPGGRDKRILGVKLFPAESKP